MQIPILRHRAFVPGGIPRINWNDPLTAGLVACYVPSAHQGPKIYNLTRQGGDLALQSGASYSTTSEGVGLNSTASNSGAFVTCPAQLQFPNFVSLYWRGLHTAIPGDSVSLLGVQYTTTDSPPYESYSIEGHSDATLLCDGGLNGNNATAQSGAIIAANKFGSYMATIDATISAFNIYSSGKLLNSVDWGSGTLSYSASSQLSMGMYVPVTTRIANVVSMLGFIWNRILSPIETQAIDLDPYRFLIFPEDEIFAYGAKKAKIKTASFDSILSLMGKTKTASVGAILQKTITKTASLGAMVQGTPSKTTSLSAFLQSTPKKTASLDARLFSSRPFATCDAILASRTLKTASLDASLVHQGNVSTSLTLSIVIPMQKSAGMNAELLADFAAPPTRTVIVPEINRTIEIT